MGQTYGKYDQVPLASQGWNHRGAKRPLMVYMQLILCMQPQYYIFQSVYFNMRGGGGNGWEMHSGRGLCCVLAFYPDPPPFCPWVTYGEL